MSEIPECDRYDGGMAHITWSWKMARMARENSTRIAELEADLARQKRRRKWALKLLKHWRRGWWDKRNEAVHWMTRTNELEAENHELRDQWYCPKCDTPIEETPIAARVEALEKMVREAADFRANLGETMLGVSDDFTEMVYGFMPKWLQDASADSISTGILAEIDDKAESAAARVEELERTIESYKVTHQDLIEQRDELRTEGRRRITELEAVVRIVRERWPDECDSIAELREALPALEDTHE